MGRGELIENLRTTFLWEMVCAHIERMNEANVLLGIAGVENGIVSIFFITYSDVEPLGMLGEKVGERMADFLEEAKAIRWFGNNMVFSLYEACDGWGKQYFDFWESRICDLEDIAMKKIGDDAIDDAFDTDSAAIGDTVWEKFGEFIDRQRLGNELAVCDEFFDRIKRNMAWACVEKVLYMLGFLPCWQKSIRKGIFHVHGMGNILPVRWLYCSGVVFRKSGRRIFFVQPGAFGQWKEINLGHDLYIQVGTKISSGQK